MILSVSMLRFGAPCAVTTMFYLAKPQAVFLAFKQEGKSFTIVVSVNFGPFSSLNCVRGTTAERSRVVKVNVALQLKRIVTAQINEILYVRFTSSLLSIHCFYSNFHREIHNNTNVNNSDSRRGPFFRRNCETSQMFRLRHVNVNLIINGDGFRSSPNSTFVFICFKLFSLKCLFYAYCYTMSIFNCFSEMKFLLSPNSEHRAYGNRSTLIYAKILLLPYQRVFLHLQR